MRSTRPILFAAVCLSAALRAAPSFAVATLHVRADGTGDYPTIQAAIDAAASQDTVELADGTYVGAGNRSLDFHGKPIVVRSASRNPASCIIDGGLAARGFYFHTNEDSSAVVEGITIKRGSSGQGGAIFCDQASPTIRNCRLVDNTAGFGGGIAAFNGSAVRLIGCDIALNNASNGGGLYFSNSAGSVVGTVIRGNTAGRGGGVELWDSADPSFDHCTITGNYSYSNGGGIYCFSSSPRVSATTLAENRAGGGGGGLSCDGNGNPVLERSIVWGNCAQPGTGYQIAIDLASAIPTLACSDVDSTGIRGVANVVYDGPLLSTDPRFCNDIGCSAPFALGDYSLLPVSPCLASASPCGQQIGALGPCSVARMTWTPDSLDQILGSGDWVDRIVRVTNAGTSNLTFTAAVSPDPSFLTVVPPSGVLAPGDGIDLIAHFETGSLPLGQYHADIEFVSNDPITPFGMVPVDLNVVDPAGIGDHAGKAEFAVRGAQWSHAAGRILVRFSLPDGADARLELWDVSGRRLDARSVGALGAGEHEVAIGVAGQPSGVYFVRLGRAGRFSTVGVAIVR